MSRSFSPTPLAMDRIYEFQFRSGVNVNASVKKAGMQNDRNVNIMEIGMNSLITNTPRGGLPNSYNSLAPIQSEFHKIVKRYLVDTLLKRNINQ